MMSGEKLFLENSSLDTIFCTLPTGSEITYPSPDAGSIPSMEDSTKVLIRDVEFSFRISCSFISVMAF